MTTPQFFEYDGTTGNIIERDATPEELAQLEADGWQPGLDTPDPLT